jgi:hypothetical protein
MPISPARIHALHLDQLPRDALPYERKSRIAHEKDSIINPMPSKEQTTPLISVNC